MGKFFSSQLNLVSSLDDLSRLCEDAEYLVADKNNLIEQQYNFIQQLTVFHLY